jgi:hypothetical protein
MGLGAAPIESAALFLFGEVKHFAARHPPSSAMRAS